MTETYDFNDRPSLERISLLRKEFPNANARLVTAFIEFQWVYRDMQRAYDELLQQYGLSESKFLILMFLRQAEKQQLLPSEIAEKLGAMRPTVSKLLTGMIKQNFIRKLDSQTDKRSSVIQLTDTGNSVLNRFLPHNFAVPQTIFEDLSFEELEQLNAILAKIKYGTQKLKKEMEKSND